MWSCKDCQFLGQASYPRYHLTCSSHPPNYDLVLPYVLNKQEREGGIIAVT